MRLPALALLLLLSAAGTSAPATRPADIVVFDDRLVATRQGESSNYSPAGYWDGSIVVTAHGVAVAVKARRQNFHDFEVVEFSLTQAREVSASYTIRTPINEADWVFVLAEPSLPLMLIRHPEVRAMLDAVLLAAGDGSGYHFGEFVLRQLDPSAYSPSEETAAHASDLIGRLGEPSWRVRRDAVREIAGDAEIALYCVLKADRDALTAEQRRGIGEALRGYTVLGPTDCAALRRITQ